MEWEDTEDFYDSIMAKMCCTLLINQRVESCKSFNIEESCLGPGECQPFFQGSTISFCFSSHAGIILVIQIPGMSRILTLVQHQKYWVNCE